MLTLPDKLTLLRILLIPVIIVLLHFPSQAMCLAALACFIVASITDFLDGFIARRYNLVSNFGKFLDPLADKLLVVSVLVMFVHLSWVQGWIVIVIIGREILVTGLRSLALEAGLVLAADRYGKIKTVLQILAVCLLMLHYPVWGFDPVPPGQIVLYMALIMTVFSGGNYLWNVWSRWGSAGSGQ